MSFKIKIDGHVPGETVYYPGDMISGDIVFIGGRLPCIDLAATVKFKGFHKVATGMGPKSIFEQGDCLAYVVYSCVSKPGSWGNGVVYSLHFMITIPEE